MRKEFQNYTRNKRPINDHNMQALEQYHNLRWSEAEGDRFNDAAYPGLCRRYVCLYGQCPSAVVHSDYHPVGTLGGTSEDHLRLFPRKCSKDRDLSGFGQRAGNLCLTLRRRHIESTLIGSAAVNPKGL